MDKYAIYCILNTKNEHRYIGVTNDPNRRKSEHFRLLRNNVNHNPHLQHAYNKYGRKAFKWIVLERGDATLDEAHKREGVWIAFYDSYHNGYNLTEISEGGQVSPVCIPCTWNGIEYESYSMAARANNMTITRLIKHIQQGCSCDDDMPPYLAICTWNGIEYPSITAAAAELGITKATMWYRVQQGYTCDDDMPRSNDAKPMIWNDTEYPSITAAAEANNVPVMTMVTRLKRGLTSDEDLGTFPTASTVVIDGVQYPSIRGAARALGLKKHNVQRMLDTGLAVKA